MMATRFEQALERVAGAGAGAEAPAPGARFQAAQARAGEMLRELGPIPSEAQTEMRGMAQRVKYDARADSYDIPGELSEADRDIVRRSVLDARYTRMLSPFELKGMVGVFERYNLGSRAGQEWVPYGPAAKRGGIGPAGWGIEFEPTQPWEIGAAGRYVHVGVPIPGAPERVDYLKKNIEWRQTGKGTGGFGKTAEALRRGNQQMELYSKGYRAALGTYSDAKVLAEMEEFQKLSAKPAGIEERWLPRQFYKAVQMLPYWYGAAERGLPVGAAAGMAAAKFGQTPALMATAEEYVTVPGAFAIGAAAGGYGYLYEQGVGEIYIDLRQNKIDHEIATGVAHAMGTAYAAAELWQMVTLTPTLGQILKRRALSAAKALAIRWAVKTGTEVGAEMLQEGVIIASEITAKGISNALRGTEFQKWPGAGEVLKRLAATGWESAGPMMLMALPGATMEARADVHQGLLEGAKQGLRSALEDSGLRNAAIEANRLVLVEGFNATLDQAKREGRVLTLDEKDAIQTFRAILKDKRKFDKLTPEEYMTKYRAPMEKLAGITAAEEAAQAPAAVADEALPAATRPTVEEIAETLDVADSLEAADVRLEADIPIEPGPPKLDDRAGFLDLALWGETLPRTLEATKTLHEMGRNVYAAVFRAHRLMKTSPDVVEKIRGVQAGRAVRAEQAMDAAMTLFENINKADRNLLFWHRENPGKYKVPTRLKHIAAAQDLIYQRVGGLLKRLGLVGDFYQERINSNQKEIDKLVAGMEELKTERGRRRRFEKIQAIENENALLQRLRYVRRLVQNPHIESQLFRFFNQPRTDAMNSKMKRMMDRKFDTLEELTEYLKESGGVLEEDAAVAMADFLAYATHKVDVHNFHKWATTQPNLVLPDPANRQAIKEGKQLAPPEWVPLPGFKEYKGYRLNPAFAEAIMDYTVGARHVGKILGTYDHINMVLKQLRFYNPFIMLLNNTQQGLGVAGLGHIFNWPRAAWHVATRSNLYRACLAADLFTEPPDIRIHTRLQDDMHAALDVMDGVTPKLVAFFEKVTGHKGRGMLGWAFVPTNRNTMLATMRYLTWKMDRVSRVASVNALLRKYPFPEAVQRARAYHADYDLLKPEALKWAKRAFLTPAYKVAMFKLQKDMLMHPRKNMGPLIRVAMMYGITLTLAAMRGYKYTNFYRFIREEEKKEGKREAVWLLPGPFAEIPKFIGRLKADLESPRLPLHTAYVWSAAIPHEVWSIARNRDWKGDQIWSRGGIAANQRKDIFKFLIREFWPMTEQIGMTLDAQEDGFNKLLRWAAISRYETGPMRKWYEYKIMNKRRDLQAEVRRRIRKDPDNEKQYEREAQAEWKWWIDHLEEQVAEHEDALEAMKSESAIDRLAAQFGFGIKKKKRRGIVKGRVRRQIRPAKGWKVRPE